MAKNSKRDIVIVIKTILILLFIATVIMYVIAFKEIAETSTPQNQILFMFLIPMGAICIILDNISDSLIKIRKSLEVKK